MSSRRGLEHLRVARSANKLVRTIHLQRWEWTDIKGSYRKRSGTVCQSVFNTDLNSIADLASTFDQGPIYFGLPVYDESTLDLLEHETDIEVGQWIVCSSSVEVSAQSSVWAKRFRTVRAWYRGVARVLLLKSRRAHCDESSLWTSFGNATLRRTMAWLYWTCGFVSSCHWLLKEYRSHFHPSITIFVHRIQSFYHETRIQDVIHHHHTPGNHERSCWQGLKFLCDAVAALWNDAKLTGRYETRGFDTARFCTSSNACHRVCYLQVVD